MVCREYYEKFSEASGKDSLEAKILKDLLKSLFIYSIIICGKMRHEREGKEAWIN